MDGDTMKRALLINSVCGIGSTGRICVDIAKELIADGWEAKIAYGRGPLPEPYQELAIRIGTDFSVYRHVLRTRIFDEHGLGSRKATSVFLRWADSFSPDLLWLHNIHGYYINYELLFDWIKRHPKMEVRWTLHDCWAFTGHCTHFIMAKCNQWETHCETCIQKRQYPTSYLVDNCRKNFERKKHVFTGVQNMLLITPSQWLADLVRSSFLKEYPVEVRHNTIDIGVFRPTSSNFREKHRLIGKKIILGVASVWDERKGLGDFVKLSSILGEDYVIVLVGLTEKQMKGLPGNIIGIRRTHSAKELAAIYTAADVFFNPTYEDNYPTVNLEAQACGTRVASYDSGGAMETVINEKLFHTIPSGDLMSFISYVYDIKTIE